ncbi:uncharacterized protein [Aegilops tauschii subsp. strangulata]|uniref:uncharacterized protein n=1 Tax=Aegilops tauschii subsp. strangulata TaxID=200361 RepID=UPI00098AEC30|nr:uncharacterized protein LOC109772231 [Aegilops tauschii subsp. strangulata]
MSMGSGASTLFWFDRWVGDRPFATRFPDLFSSTVDPGISVEVALVDLGRLAFQRPFGPMELVAWQELLECIALQSPGANQTHDRISWHLETSGCFSTKSLYQNIAASPGPEPLALIWAIRLPLKIQIFLRQ